MSVYVMAELGSVPDGSLGNTLKLIELVAKAGANAAKLQDHRGEKVKGNPPWASDIAKIESRAAYLQRTSFDENGWRLIRATCTACGVDLVVSPFSVEAVRLLEQVPVDAYKVASGQVTNHEMLRAIGATFRRTFVSSGMTTLEETFLGIREICMGGLERDWKQQVGDFSGRVTRMVCTSEYPCKPEHVGLNRIDKTVGFSDHTLGFAASLAAITLGATVIERHVGFHRGMFGTDARHSLTLEELAAFVREVRDLEKMLANPVDKDALVQTPEMQAMRAAFLEKP